MLLNRQNEIKFQESIEAKIKYSASYLDVDLENLLKKSNLFELESDQKNVEIS